MFSFLKGRDKQPSSTPSASPTPAADPQSSSSRDERKGKARLKDHAGGTELYATGPEPRSSPAGIGVAAARSGQAPLQAGFGAGAALLRGATKTSENYYKIESVERDLSRYAAQVPLVAQLKANALPPETSFATVDAIYQDLERIRMGLEAPELTGPTFTSLTEMVVREMTELGEAIETWYAPQRDPELTERMERAWDERAAHDMDYQPMSESWAYSQRWAYDALYSRAPALPRTAPAQSAEEFEAARTSAPGDRWREDGGAWHFSAPGGKDAAHAEASYRVYINPLPDYVGPVMDYVFGRLGCQGLGAGRAHKMKTTAPDEHGTRTDSIVVYIGNTPDGEVERDRIIAALRDYQAEPWPEHEGTRAAMFAQRHPPLTSPAEDTVGVSWGQQPAVQGASFGQVRFEAIEDALGEVMNDNQCTRADFMRQASRKLTDLGIDPKHPALQGELIGNGGTYVPKQRYVAGEQGETEATASSSHEASTSYASEPEARRGGPPERPPRPHATPGAARGAPPDVASRVRPGIPQPAAPGAPLGAPPQVAPRVRPGTPQPAAPGAARGGPPQVAPRVPPRPQPPAPSAAPGTSTSTPVPAASGSRSGVKTLAQQFADKPIMGGKPPTRN